ncbi:MAG: mucoidy inhibitor MuiA family protein [Firmicutes bacterium]|nr:mucoidy inhibitor MuiA family protein [Bacillota bacterium]
MQIIDTKTTSVQIYRSGAEIVRYGTLTLPEGLSNVMIRGLSWDAHMDTAKLFFPEQIQLSDIRFTSLADEESKPSARLQEEIDAIKNRLEIKKLQISLWKENGSFSSRSETSVKEIENYILELPDRLETLYQETQALEAELGKKEKELKKETRVETLPVLAVELIASQAGTYGFEIHCFEQNAAWQSVYEIHTDAAGPLSIRARARIFQNTAEDWENVKVSLLTGKPSSGRLPSLRTQYVNIRQEIPRPAFNMQPSGSSAPFVGGMAMAMKAAAPRAAQNDSLMESSAILQTAQLSQAATADADVSTEDTMTEYHLPMPKTIPTGIDGNSQGTVADLQQFDVPAAYEMIVIPKADIKGYFVARVNPKDLPETISGIAGVYLKGVYTGEAQIFPQTEAETIDISLGSEESLHATRILKNKKTAQSILKSTKSTDTVYELKVRNNKDSAVNVTLEDQIPVSQDKQIVVDLLQSDHAEVNADTGLLKWHLQIGPKETKTLQFAYRITWPKDKTLQETTALPGPSGQRSALSMSNQRTGRFCPVCGAFVDGPFCPECGSKMN